MANVIQGIHQECARVRDELLPQYRAIGMAGAFGLVMLEAAVKEGEAAIESGDIVRMLRALAKLKDCE